VTAVPDGSSIEIAHSLVEDEQGHVPVHHSGWHRLLEVLEVAVLAVVAVATAWSGFQAAQWDGRQTLLYGQSSRARFEADAASTFGGQLLAANAGFFTGWLQARASGQPKLATMFVARMTPDYKTAFDDWQKTDPFNNPKAPAGPGSMPGYKNPYFEKADKLNEQSDQLFEKGTAADDTAGKYVRDTVLLAMVLFIVAIAQRVKDRAVRTGANVVALLVLAYALVSVVDLARI
jgi:hypothetical protein